MSRYDQIISRIIPDVEFHQNRYARELDSRVVEGVRWLDIGAGIRVHGGWTGRSQQEIVNRARLVIGFDLVKEHLARNELLSGAVLASAEDIPFGEASFDVVTANMVLEHIRNPEGVFKEIARVLAPGGSFIFVTPNSRNPVVRVARWAVAPDGRKELAHRVEGRPSEQIFPTYYRANTTSEISGLARVSGLSITLLEVFRSYPFIRKLSVLVALEAMWIRAQRLGPLRRFGSNIVAVLQKPLPDAVS